MHTSAPWEHDGDGSIYARREFGRVFIAEVERVVNSEDANARLIAAAPDLLSALQRSEQYLMLAVHDNKGDLRKIAEQDLALVRAALVKATRP